MAEDESERLAKLVADLTSDPDYASGRRAYPRTVTVDDAVAITNELHLQLDQATDAREKYAADEGMTIACKMGCNSCCNEMVMVSEPEAQAAARWLVQPENRAVREAFLARYPAWRKNAGDAPERLHEASNTMIKADYSQLYASIAINQRSMCAFNDESGGCSLYPARPVICRKAHALDTSDFCGPHLPSTGRLQVLQFDPLDQFVKRAFWLLWATHHAIGGQRSKATSLCQRVYELIEGHSPGG